MHAIAGSLTALSNGAGVYYLLGDETTHDEGPNMQQIPRREQSLYLKLTSVLGPSYSIHTPESINTALRRGINAVCNPIWPSSFLPAASHERAAADHPGLQFACISATF